MLAAMMMGALLGCSGEDENPPVVMDTGGEPLPSEPTDFTPPDEMVITVETRDGVMLEGDLYPTGIEGGPAVLLLHMIPPGNDRTNWPTDFIDLLVAQGWAVLALDRRGAGGSDGVAQEAYEGDNGKFDAEAATLALIDGGYGDLAIIGASNGTTSLLDYTVWAGGEGLPVPVAIGFMTGGGYTETQNDMELLDSSIPAVFTYSTAERAWSEEQRPLDQGSWSFLEYDGGAHGTSMFSAKPRVKGDLIDFLQKSL